MNVTEKTIGNYRICINYDEYPENPRIWDNLGKMVCFHRRYNLGDKNHGYSSNQFESWGELENTIRENENVHTILPLYLYDHGGITISTNSFNDSWDSGKIGYIFVTNRMVKENGLDIENKELIQRILEGEVETYDKYLRGDIYTYSVYKITTCNFGHKHEELVESCGGYQDEDEAMSEAEHIVNNYKESVCS